MSKTHPQSQSAIRNLDELDFKPWGHGEKYKARHAQVSIGLGARKLGYGVVVLPPGKTAWPYHQHLINEEMFFILEGQGTLRLNGEETPVRACDFIAVPPGRQSGHQIKNTTDRDLKYLAVSTKEMPEVVEYPDSGKTAFVAPVGEDAQGKPELLRAIYAQDTPQAGYWDGED